MCKSCGSHDEYCVDCKDQWKTKLWKLDPKGKHFIDPVVTCEVGFVWMIILMQMEIFIITVLKNGHLFGS